MLSLPKTGSAWRGSRVHLPSGRSTVWEGHPAGSSPSHLTVKTPLEERGIQIPDWNYSSDPRALTAASEEA